MCGNNTKQRIADALRQMMKTRPFHKISVQSLMDETNMKRQSFYYHFQDTREVLEWICRKQLTEKLLSYQAPLLEQILYALKLVDQDRDFYRQVTRAVHQDAMYRFGDEILCPWLSWYFYQCDDHRLLTPNQAFVVEFVSKAAINYCIQFLRSREPLDEALARERITALLDVFRGAEFQLSGEFCRCGRITEAF